MKHTILSVLACAAMALVLACGGGSKGESTTPSGDGDGSAEPAGDGAAAFTPGDATKGAAVFEDACSTCHGDEGEGAGKTPAVRGDGTLAKFADDAALAEYVKKEMPADDPGSLSDEQVADVVAWMRGS